MMDPAAVARRCAGTRPGYELIHYEAVGVPFYRLDLDSLVQRQKPIGPIHEFVLRAASSGLDQVDDVTGFLGVERKLVERTVVDLSRQDLIDYRLEDDHHVLRVTPLGVRSMEEMIQIVPDRVNLTVGFDRITWKVTSRYLRDLIRPRDAREEGLLELPARRTRRLSADDIDIDDAQRDLRGNWSTKLGTMQLISVADVSNTRMLLPATALVFMSDTGQDQQVAIAIDGRMSDSHGLAFAEYQGPKACGLVVEDRVGPADVPELPTDVRARRVDRKEVALLESRVAGALKSLSDARTATATATEIGSGADEEAAVSAVVESTAVAEEAEAALADLPIRSIQTYEHRTLLHEAVTSAKHRLLIISPWIRSDVVDGRFIDSLRSRAQRGVLIDIGWGINDDDDPRAKRPLEQLNRLAGEFDNLTLAQLGNTHAKILVWDDHLVVTSFNWLSFSGDQRRGFRQEEGTLISDPAYVQAQYLMYLSQIRSTDHV